MSDRPWRGPVNQLIYGLMFSPLLDDTALDNLADAITTRRGLSLPPDAYYDAITAALDSGDLSGLIETPHGEADLIDFLRRLRARLDELRPWPVPAFSKLPATEWPSFARAKPIAQIEETLLQTQDRLRERFDPLPDGDGTIRVLLLKLRDGETVGLLGASGPGRITLLQRDPGDPEQTINAYAEASGLPRELLTPLH